MGKKSLLLIYYKSENVEGNIDVTAENIKPDFSEKDLIIKVKEIIREANGWESEQKIIIANIINLTKILKELRWMLNRDDLIKEIEMEMSRVQGIISDYQDTVHEADCLICEDDEDISELEYILEELKDIF